MPNSITTTKEYEPNRDLLTAVVNKFGTTTISGYAYANDAVGSRTSMAKVGTAFSQTDSVAYLYNSRRELTSAAAQNDQTYNYAYGYDNIGNRVTATESGTAKTYASNNLNQYTSITNPAQAPAYDADGNMTSDGTGWTYTWDAENRLNSATNGTQTLEFKYDYLSRRVEKKVLSGATVTKHERYLYDGWNILEKLDGANDNGVIGKNIWGLDLAGTLQTPQKDQATGGVGALLSALDAVGNARYCFYDANGNVGQVLDSTGTITAKYEYTPFGGVSACAETVPNDFRFSTKFFDTETGLVYYGYRYYSPSLGRWLSKDPIAENGGFNLYVHTSNNPIGKIDKNGQWVHIAAGGFIGGAIGGITAWSQGKSVTAGIIGGAVAGAVTAATFNPALGLATAAGLSGVAAGTTAGIAAGAAGGLAGGIASETTNAAQGNGFDAGNIATSTLSNAIGGGLTGGLVGQLAPTITAYDQLMITVIDTDIQAISPVIEYIIKDSGCECK